MEPRENGPWPTVRLGDVLAERTESPDPGDIETGAIPIIAKISFSQGTIELRDDGRTRTRMILVRPGDMVVSGINAAKGAIAIYDERETSPVSATIHYAAYVPDQSRVDIKYLWRLLRSDTFRRILKRSLPGGVKTELKAKRLLPIPIPLPPLDEQRRIVARIEELAALIEEAQTLRAKAREEANALLHAKLALVFDALVDENGSRRLHEIIVNAGYGTSIKCGYDRSGDAVPVLRIPNVSSERIHFEDMKYGVLTSGERHRVLVESDDILVVRTCGSAGLVGRSALVPELSEATAFASYLIRLRCDAAKVLPSYLQLMLRHMRVQGILFGLARTTAGQYNVSLGRLYAAEIPVPKLSDQARIAFFFDTLQGHLHELSALQNYTQGDLDALLPSVLDRAFQEEL